MQNCLYLLTENTACQAVDVLWEYNFTSSVRTAQWCPDVVITDHCGLGFTGEMAARGLVERTAAGRAVTRAVRGRVGPSVAGYGRLPT